MARIVETSELPPRIGWDFFFADPDRPVEVEFGTGRGAFLKQAARHRPNTNWLGVDYAGKFLRTAARRLKSGGCDNVTLYHGAFEPLLAELPASSVRALHAYFPDPWHKKRHFKRRFLRPDTLHWIRRVLEPGGWLYLRTDVPTYFENMQEELAAAGAGFEIDAPMTYFELPSEDWFPTNYERRFLREGLPCHAISARKRS